MFATIYLPNFFLQAAIRHQPELVTKPVALLDDGNPKSVIIQLNQIALNHGVKKGMTASQGLARCLQLVMKMRVRTQEKSLDDSLLQHAGTLAPYLEATAPGICTLQFTDPRHLQPKVRHLIDQLAAAGITARAGIADSPDTSYFAAHLANPVLEITDAKKFLDPLPIETLVTTAETQRL